MTAPPASIGRPRAVFLNNEILPYRIPLFNALHECSDLETFILFSTFRSRERHWRIDPAGLTFPHRILPGICLRPPKPYLSEKRSIYINPTLLWEFARLRPDVVIGYEFSVPSMTALLYSRIAGCPFLVWSECTGISDRHLTRGQRWTRRIIIPRAQGFFGTSPPACKNLIALGAPPERVVEAPQVQRVGWIAEQSAQARKPKDAPGKVVLYIGSLIERKGVELLLQAFSRVRMDCPTVRLRIVGEGPRQKTLAKLAAELGIQDRVDFAGFVQPADIPLEFVHADVFVLPSLEDTFAVVVVESLASGTPVICSSFAGVSAYLKDGRDAFVVDPNDTELLAERILQLLHEAPLRDLFTAHGREIARRFEARSVAKVFITEILRVAGRGRA
jgi:glycosyltransferase involved in cell wall biosynthesis